MPIDPEHARLKPRITLPRSARGRTAMAAALSLSVVTLVFLIPLASYWRSYFPYEDDFSLILFSARENNPQPLAWITEGFRKYFMNDPACPADAWGFVRPAVNLAHYIESWLGMPAEGVRLMMTNVACWLVSLVLLFALARRLGLGRWVASAVVVLYGLSPCWYRNLIHSSFRNNGLAACWTLVAFVLILWSDRGRRRVRWLAAGLAAACAAATHEQALANIVVFAVVAVFCAARQTGGKRIFEWAIGTALTCVPAIVVVLGFHFLNAAYGHNYATSGFLGSAAGPAVPLTVKAAVVAVRVARAVANAPHAFAPSGADNLVALPLAVGKLIFIAALVAAAAVWWKERRVEFAATMMLVYALSREFAGFGEPRFTHMEVAWAVLLAMLSLSTARRHGIRLGIIASSLAITGLLGFNLASVHATILDHRSDLLRRNAADRRSFQAIRAALAGNPGARVVLINDQLGMWSARSMLQLAGAGDRRIEILPTITPLVVSTDFIRDYGTCDAVTTVEPHGGDYLIHMSYPKTCQVLVFGRDLGCTVSQFKRQQLPTNAEWAACSASNNCPPQIIHKLRLSRGERALLITWQSRLTPASVRIIESREPSTAAKHPPAPADRPTSGESRMQGPGRLKA